jgi:hypothetical protein
MVCADVYQGAGLNYRLLKVLGWQDLSIGPS